MSNISNRLLEERKRLGLTQDKMAEIGKIAKRSYCHYEAGEREPSASFFSEIAVAGFDILYILTGFKSEKSPLNEREKALLENYENTDEFGKRIIEATAAEAASPVKKGAGEE